MCERERREEAGFVWAARPSIIWDEMQSVRPSQASSAIAIAIAIIITITIGIGIGIRRDPVPQS
jgi:hypothetical protein